MKKMLTLVNIEGKLTIRSLDSIVFGIGMPVGILFLIGMIAGNKVTSGPLDMTYLQSAFPALVTVGICATAFMGIPLTISDYRDKKILKHFFVTPASPMNLVFANTCVAALTAIVSAAAVSLIAVIVFNYRMEGSVATFILGFLLLMISMYPIGMLIASLCKTLKRANLVTSLVYFPMLFLSGATIPYEIFPKGLQAFADILPLTHGIKILKSISMDVPLDGLGLSIVYILALSVVCVIVSIATFKWE